VIHNDYASLPHKRGLPEGHAAVVRELVVPIMRNDRIVAILGVGNKPSQYTDTDVQIVSYVADVAWEIIERKRAEDALREAYRQRDDFLAMLSHELRNPLAPIHNGLHILEHAAAGSEQRKRAEATIGRQVAQLTRLVDDLLDATRLTRGKLRLERKRFDLVQEVRRSAEDHQGLFDRAGVQLDVRVPCEPVVVDGDPIRIAQVVGNLLSNAAKFTGRGGRAMLAVEVDARAGEAIVQVRDTGVGISGDVLPRLFEAFTQANTTLDRTKGGLGLGLMIVKGVVESHGGRVEAHSAGLGAGAEVTIRLPILTTVTRGATSEAPAFPTAPRRVLVIEDNVDAADSLRDMLELDGHRVVVAHEGAAGIESARNLVPDIVLCDLGLPGMDGYAVARAFKADEALRSVYLVALTGYAQPDDLQMAARAGFDEHLPKPANPERIAAVLAHAGLRH
jgi:two-component system CheB/CheR fusion protein